MQLSLSFVILETTDLRGRKEGGGEFTHKLVLRGFEPETIDHTFPLWYNPKHALSFLFLFFSMNMPHI